jgi:alpha-tubulin suppressor-like RCC1 family protein
MVHELAGPVRVEAGGTLEIEPGTRIEARPGVGIDVQRDGLLMANGTLLEPIVMTCTSSTKYAGCWNGLRIHGFARINFGTPDSPADPQGGSSGCLQRRDDINDYGGCSDTDSNGSLRFVRVEYAAEGVRLRGVGSGTTFEEVQVNRALGDGLAIEGGAVDIRRVFLTANGGVGLSWRAGWRGRAQFIVVQQDAELTGGGIRGSNAGVSGTLFTNLPRSAPTLYNVTVIAPVSGAAAGERPALHLLEGTSVTLRNVLVHSSALVLDIDQNSTCSSFGNTDGVSIANVVLAANTLLGSPDVDPLGCEPYLSPNIEAELLNDVATAATVVTDPAALLALVRQATNLIVPDLRPAFGGAPSTSPVATPPVDGFFDGSARYIGAVAPLSASRNNIPWYSGWTTPAPTPPTPGMVSGVVTSAALGPVANVVVSTAFGARDTTDAGGAFSLVLPVGQHVLGVTGLPIGCSAAPFVVTTTSGGTASVSIPVECTVATDITVGTLHACLMATDHRLQCWGQNDFGMVGDGTTVTPRSRPVVAAGNLMYDPFTMAAGLTHTCAIRVSTTYCWGLNVFGVLGLGTTGAFAASPVAAGSFSTPTFNKVAAGGYHQCGLTSTGEAWCWGWNAEGQIGANSAAFSIATPTAVAAGSTKFEMLALGESHTCGLTAAGTAWCWGGNGRGEAGRDTAGADLKSNVPVLVNTSLAFASIDAGTLHTCALTADGTAYCWGSREFGQLGDGSTVGIAATPVAVSTSERFVQIVAGGFTTCGVTTTQRVLCWGAGGAGALGNGTNPLAQATPVEASLAMNASRVAVGLGSDAAATVCAVMINGTVYCWGAGSAGQLGNGTTQFSAVPVQVLVRGPF